MLVWNESIERLQTRSITEKPDSVPLTHSPLHAMRALSGHMGDRVSRILQHFQCFLVKYLEMTDFTAIERWRASNGVWKKLQREPQRRGSGQCIRGHDAVHYICRKAEKGPGRSGPQFQGLLHGA